MFKPQGKQPTNDFELNPMLAGRELALLVMYNLGAVSFWYEDGDYHFYFPNDSTWSCLQMIQDLKWEEKIWSKKPAQSTYFYVIALQNMALAKFIVHSEPTIPYIDPIYFGV